MKHQHFNFDLVTFYCLDCPLRIFFTTYKVHQKESSIYKLIKIHYWAVHQ